MTDKKIEPTNPDEATAKTEDETKAADRKTSSYRFGGRKVMRALSRKSGSYRWGG